MSESDCKEKKVPVNWSVAVCNSIKKTLKNFTRCEPVFHCLSQLAPYKKYLLADFLVDNAFRQRQVLGLLSE